MAPPPPLKFISFLRRSNKSQPGPPTDPLYTPDSQEPIPIPNVHLNGHGTSPRDQDLAEKKAMWQDGQHLLDRTKDLLEMGSGMLGKEATKRFRKEAAKLTKGAPSKSKLPKKSLDEVGTFQQNAKTLFQEVDRILRELEQHPSHYPEPVALPHPQAADQRSTRSESPPPLPRKPPSPKVTFNNSDVKPDSNVNLTRKSSTKRGPDPREQQHLVAPEMVRQDSSRHRDREADLTRSASERVPERHSSRKYEEGRDDPKRSDSRRHPSEAYRTDPYSDPYYKGHSDRDKDYKRPSHNRYYSDSRGQDAYYESRSRKYDEVDVERQRSRREEKEGARMEAPRGDPRVVHADQPLAEAPGGNGVPFSPTYVRYPEDEERRRKDREREKERERMDRDRDRDRDRGTDRDRERRRERERDPDYDRSRRRHDDYYRSSRDKYDDRYRSDKYDKYGSKSSRRYEDDYYRSSRSKKYDYYDRDRDRPRDQDRDRDRDRERDRDRHRDKDRPRERDRERDKGRERDRDRDDREGKRHHDEEPNPDAQDGDPSASKFQEVFSPPEHHGGGLPAPSVHGG